MGKLVAEMTPEEVEHKREYNRKRQANRTTEEKENLLQRNRPNTQAWRAKNHPIDPAVYCIRVGLSTAKIGKANRPNKRKTELFTATDLVYAHLYFLAKFETIELAHGAEKGAHIFLERCLGLPRLRHLSGYPSEQFTFKDHPEWQFHLREFLAAQPGFTHFEIYDPSIR